MNVNFSTVFSVVRVLYFVLLVTLLVFVYKSGFNSLVMKRFESNYSAYLKAAQMPIVKKYLDRPAIREQLEDKELTIYANDLASQAGIVNKEFVVLIATEEDPYFMASKCVLGFDLVDTFMILFEKSFVENNSREVIKSFVALNVGRCVKNDLLTRFTVLQESFYSKLAMTVGLSLVFCPLAATVSSAIAFGVSSFAVSHLVFLCLYAQFVQQQDLSSDAFVVNNNGGKEAAVEMINAIITAAPTPEQSIFAKTIARLIGFASYEQRLNAINNL